MGHLVYLEAFEITDLLSGTVSDTVQERLQGFLDLGERNATKELIAAAVETGEVSAELVDRLKARGMKQETVDSVLTASGAKMEIAEVVVVDATEAAEVV